MTIILPATNRFPLIQEHGSLAVLQEHNFRSVSGGQLGWDGTGTLPWQRVTMTTCYNDSVTMKTCNHDTVLPWQRVTITTCYHDSVLPWHRVIPWQRVTTTTCYHDNVLPWQRVTITPCFRASRSRRQLSCRFCSSLTRLWVTRCHRGSGTRSTSRLV